MCCCSEGDLIVSMYMYIYMTASDRGIVTEVE